MIKRQSKRIRAEERKKIKDGIKKEKQKLNSSLPFQSVIQEPVFQNALKLTTTIIKQIDLTDYVKLDKDWAPTKIIEF